ncbi:MAG: methionyl-tRNA formyltransferase [Desulfobacterales bacterium]|nr:methionyl-tRNA formyltransferase [Desulfobacterales bacterium]
MKTVFIGCVEIGHTVLQRLYEAGGRVDLVVTLDRALVGKTSGFVDFHPLAAANGSTVLTTEDINRPETVAALAALAPDVVIVCGWQQILSRQVLEIAGRGTVGFHSSLLPKYRGHAPVNWAILLGEKRTGATFFFLDHRADCGDIIDQEAFDITAADDCATVYAKSAEACARMLSTHLSAIADGTVARRHNPSASYPAYPRRRPEDGLIDFNRPATDVFNWVRALTRPYPGAFFFRGKEKIRVWRAEMGEKPGDGHLVMETADLPVTVTDWEVCHD